VADFLREKIALKKLGPEIQWADFLREKIAL
jgi:hypothetical protein